MRRFARGSKVSVLCGPGNNGGDGFVCARTLRERGYQVRLALICKPEELGPDSKEMARRWDETDRAALAARSSKAPKLSSTRSWGSGLKGPVNGVVGQIIEQVNERELPVVAVDVPTGIDPTFGNIQGIAFKAVSTVTFFRRKTGHVLLPAKRYCGDVRAIDIGIPNSVLAEIVPQTFVNEPDFWLRYFPRLKPDGHKYDRGHAVVVSGPMESTGAARLGARAALRVGAGLVSRSRRRRRPSTSTRRSSPRSWCRPMKAPAVSPRSSPITRRNAVLIGPGAGATAETRENVAAVLSSEATVVIDAEGLTAFADNPQELFAPHSAAAVTDHPDAA